jgi:hypothetical protein
MIASYYFSKKAPELESPPAPSGSRKPECRKPKKALRRFPLNFAETERRARFIFDDQLALFSFYGVL